MALGDGVTVRVDLNRIRSNLEAIRRRVKCKVLAVVKADAYGLGAKDVTDAIDDLVDGYCFFTLEEVHAAKIRPRSRKLVQLLGPPTSPNPNDYLALKTNPAVHTVDQAAALRRAGPALAIDTGMQRFACPPRWIDEALEAGECPAAMTHAVRPDQARKLLELTAGRPLFRHAAGSGMLDDPTAWLDAVRVGLAIYEGAMRVSTPLLETNSSVGPVGYGGFTTATGHHGAIGVGYSHGLRSGPCVINGRPSRILEVGMQTAYVQTSGSDRAGDPVTLLGDGLSERDVVAAWGGPPQQVLVQLARLARTTGRPIEYGRFDA